MQIVTDHTGDSITGWCAKYLYEDSISFTQHSDGITVTDDGQDILIIGDLKPGNRHIFTGVDPANIPADWAIDYYFLIQDESTPPVDMWTMTPIHPDYTP